MLAGCVQQRQSALRWGYIALSLNLELGVHMSLEKSVVDPTLVLLVLGFWVDAFRRCFHFSTGAVFPGSGHVGSVKDDPTVRGFD